MKFAGTIDRWRSDGFQSTRTVDNKAARGLWSGPGGRTAIHAPSGTQLHCGGGGCLP